jgi:hypothetical protein
MADPCDETRAAPKLNRGTLEKLLGLVDSFTIVSASEALYPTNCFSDPTK